jgi:hypothetical protein
VSLWVARLLDSRRSYGLQLFTSFFITASDAPVTGRSGPSLDGVSERDINSNQSMQSDNSFNSSSGTKPNLEAASISKEVENPKEKLFKGIVPPQAKGVAIKTLRKLGEIFVSKRHSPSALMWEAISDIVVTLEHMANETAEDAVYVSSLDPGVGKTQSIVQFLPMMLGSDQHDDVSALVCAGRLKHIEDVINDAKNAGLRDCDFAVFTSDERLNRLGCGIENRHSARVLFTTHAMVMKKCEVNGSFTEANDFFYRHQRRAVRVWDEAFMPGLAVTFNQNDIASLIKPMSAVSTDFADQLLDLAATLRKSKDQDRLVVPDLQARCGVDLNTLERVFSDAPEDQKTAANSLWFLFDKTVTVRRDGRYGNAMIDYRETLPKGLAPLLVLDASSRRSIRETYNLWEEERGKIIRLRDAPKDYSALTIHHWNTAGGKTAFKDPTTGARLIQGVANTISSKPTEKWLVVHHKHPSLIVMLGVCRWLRVRSWLIAGCPPHDRASRGLASKHNGMLCKAT